MGKVVSRIKRGVRKTVASWSRGKEAEGIYKRERELAYAQAERRKALTLAERGKRAPTGGKTGKLLKGIENWGEGVSKQFDFEPTGIGLGFGETRKRRKKKR